MDVILIDPPFIKHIQQKQGRKLKECISHQDFQKHAL